MALSSDKSFNRETIRKTVSDGSAFLSGCSTIEFDQISRHQIYSAIDNSKLSTKKNIKEAYKYLKSELSHIPSFEEFNKYAEISFELVIENYGSYYQLIKECEKENFPYTLSNEELFALNYLSTKIAKGKHYESINLLNQLIDSHEKVAEIQIPYITKQQKVAYKILSHQYNIIPKTQKSI